MTAVLAQAVLFDLDGTLVDTAADLCAAANAVRRQHDRPALAVATLRPSVSRGSRAMLAVAFPDLDAERREALVPLFLESYGAAIAVHSALFDGVDRVLAWLESRRVPWGIVTNKPERLARQVIDAIGLTSRCQVLIGGDTLTRRKPDPLPLLEACRRLGVEPSQSVYVGDDARDIEAALAAGMKGLAAAWGYREAADRIDSWGAHCVIESAVGLLQPGVLGPHPEPPHERG